MMKKQLIITIAIFSLLLLSCKNESKTEETFHEEKELVNEKSEMDGHTSINSLDWEGTYEGTLPCVDCDGIYTELILNNNNTYILHTTKLMDDTESKNTSEGNYQWDESGSIVALSNKGLTINYKVGENMVTLLNQNREPMPESAIANYTLLKKLN
ncbi:copper resistance protein NlpE [Flavobacterium sp. SM2513]|uniref:copper resistance protein NlpE n=1 Tax=Flavobacterium sp. SM2513 TaxID=3424766 RepID=UPI003D7F2DBE